MEKLREIVDYDFFDDLKLNNIKSIIKGNCKFSFYIIVKDDTLLDAKTIISLLNQTFCWFEIVIFNCSSKDIDVFLNKNEIEDKRINIINVKTIEEEDICFHTKSDYLIKIEFGTYLVNTYLDTIFVNITINKNANIFLTNTINRINKSINNNIIINLARRRLCIFTETFCFKKNILHDVLYQNYSNKNIVHLNYYGVYETKSPKINFTITGSLYNYPKSANYFYNSEPINVKILPNTSTFEKSILCFMPWAKIGGADLFNLNIIKHLKSEGYNIVVITTENCLYEARQLFEKYIDAYYDLPSFLPRQCWPDFIKNIIENFNIDLIFQMNSLYFYHLIPWIKYYFPKLPIIEYLHAEDFSWRNGGYPKDSTAVQSFIDKTYTCNNHLKYLMHEKMNRNIEKVETLYIGVDTDKFNAKETTITDKEIETFCKNKKVILFPSRFSYEKRPLFLLNVIKKFKQKNCDIVCLMVGDGIAKSDMLNFIEKNNLGEYVRIIPLQKDIRQYYKMSDVTVICSLSEGITLTTYESLSMNVPVITSDVGGQSEVVTKENGIVIRTFQDITKDLYNFNYSQEEIELYEDAICKVLNNSDKYKNCRNSVINNYSQKLLFDSISDDIKKLIKSKSNFNLNVDINFAIRFLVLFNESSKVYYNNSLEFDDYKEYIKNRMWSKKWWRFVVKILKKFKIDKIIKRMFFKEK